MKAICYHAPHDLRFQDLPDPELRGRDEVIVRVEFSAICGSDLHVWHGRERGLDIGTAMGHEFVGVVEEASENSGFAIGTRVVAPFTTSCGRCTPCLRGLSCRCELGALFGWRENGRGLHGAQAEKVRVPHASSTLLAIPEGLRPEVALLAGDVLSTGWYCALRGEVSEAKSAAVIGLGPVGLMACIAAREQGASMVLAVDPLPERRALAERFGAESCAPDAARGWASTLPGGGFDCALEAVGSPAATRIAYEILAPGGTLSAAGVHNEPHLDLSPTEIYDKNLSYRGGRCPARALAPAMLEFLQRTDDDLSALFTHRLPLHAGVEGYRLFDEKRDGCIKVLLEP